MKIKDKDNDAHKSLRNKVQKSVIDKRKVLLMMTVHKGKLEIVGDNDSVTISKENEVVNNGLKELASNMLKIEDAKDANNESLEFSVYNLDMPETFHVPKFPVQFRKRGWNKDVARKQVRNILANYGFGSGKYKCYKAKYQTKESKVAMKPPGWPDGEVKWSTFDPNLVKLQEANLIIESMLRYRGIDPHEHHCEVTSTNDDAPADVPAHEEDDARGVHQEDTADDAGGAHREGAASDQEDDHGREGQEEFHHGLTMDESETNYWSFSEQQWFPLTMNESADFYWDYPNQTWSRFK